MVVLVGVPGDVGKMVLLLELRTWLWSDAVSAFVRNCHVFSRVTLLVVPHLKSLVLQLFLLELNLLNSHCQLVYGVLRRVRRLLLMMLMKLLRCWRHGCVWGGWGMSAGLLGHIVRVHLLPCMDGPHKGRVGVKIIWFRGGGCNVLMGVFLI